MLVFPTLWELIKSFFKPTPKPVKVTVPVSNKRPKYLH